MKLRSLIILAVLLTCLGMSVVYNTASSLDGINPPHAVDTSGKAIPESSATQPDKPFILSKDSNDPKWGELVMACVVLKPGQALTVEELIAYCRRSLASYKVPRRVEFSETDLPKSGSGKILKRVLRERFWANQQRAVS